MPPQVLCALSRHENFRKGFSLAFAVSLGRFPLELSHGADRLDRRVLITAVSDDQVERRQEMELVGDDEPENGSRVELPECLRAGLFVRRLARAGDRQEQ